MTFPLKTIGFFKSAAVDTSFKLTYDTSLGVGTTITLPLPSGPTYDFWWTPYTGATPLHVTAYNDANATYDYGIHGTYNVSVGVNSGDKCGGWSFNNIGDKLKVISVDQWGDVGFDYTKGMFFGCSNNTALPSDSTWVNTITDGDDVFRNNALTSLPSDMTLESLTSADHMFHFNSITTLPSGMVLANLINGTYMFNNNGLTSLPSVMTLASLTSGDNMFNGCSLASLPSVMTLASLTNGVYMFNGNSITTLPSGMTLASLTSGAYMFYDNGLTSLSSTLTLASLTSGAYMFRYNGLTSLPNTMTLASLTNGDSMFRNNSLTSLSSAMTLATLTNGNNMFRGCSITTLPSGMTLASLTSGESMFVTNTIATNDYSQLINNIDANNSNTGVTFNGGNSAYNSSAQTAHDNLTITKSWVITDGGLV